MEKKLKHAVCVHLHEAFLLSEDTDDTSVIRQIFIDMLTDNNKKSNSIILENLVIFLEKYYNKQISLNPEAEKDTGELKRKNTVMSNESGGF
jgi:hypothetical protein